MGAPAEEIGQNPMKSSMSHPRWLLGALLAASALVAVAVVGVTSSSQSADAQAAFALTIDDPSYTAVVDAYSFNAGAVGANDPDALEPDRYQGLTGLVAKPARVFVAISSGDAQPLYRLATSRLRVGTVSLVGAQSEIVLTDAAVDGVEISESPDRELVVAFSYRTLSFRDASAPSATWCWDFARDGEC
jgi:hypothetical protein